MCPMSKIADSDAALRIDYINIMRLIETSEDRLVLMDDLEAGMLQVIYHIRPSS